MNDLTPQQRKIAYGLALVLLFVPIILLGRPATVASEDRDADSDAGGTLSQKRAEFTLGEASLGNVDPSSSTMNLVLFGLRGVATNVLWVDAMDAKEKKDWARLRSTVDSITLLQPHYEKVWDFQGWNLAYNVSAEWDNVGDRWFWVKEGGKFVMDGVERNAQSPDLRFKVGQIMGQKIGNADEKKYYRNYFVNDPDERRYAGGTDADFNRSPYEGEADFQHHHLGAKRWYEYANVADADPEMPRQSQMLTELFRAKPAESQRLYAEAIEEEGTFGEAARSGWQQAFDDWSAFGRQPLVSRLGPIILDPDGPPEVERLADELNAAYERAGVDQRVSPPDLMREIARKRQDLNYAFWKGKTFAESRPDTVAAREAVYRGKQLFYRGEPGDQKAAAEKLREGLALWEKALDESATLRSNGALQQDLLVALHYLRDALRFSGGADDLPPDVPLYDLWENSADQGRVEAEDEYQYQMRHGIVQG